MNTVSPRWLPLSVNVLGAAVVGYSLVRTDALPAWAFSVSLVAVAAWPLWAVVYALGLRRLSLAFTVIAALAGGLAAAPSRGLAMVPAVVALLAVLGRIELPLGFGVGLGLTTVAVLAIGALAIATPMLALLAMLAGILLAALAGLSRRQFRMAEAQSARLRDQELQMSQERARLDLLDQRQAVARDIHDVLAHSLGGLVIQLDAVDAVLETGDVHAAQERVAQARGLAAEGLSEARRAVAALRHPDTVEAQALSPEQLSLSFDDLLAAHRSLGGVADFEVRGHPQALGPAASSALQRALQEALSNARKHAQNEPVQIRLEWDDDRVRLTVSNPLADGAHPVLAASGGRHGLDGMRERFSALGGLATAGVEGENFTVVAEATTR